MRKTLTVLLCAVLLCSLLGAASADAVITRNGYAAYLGESNYLYLRDTQGVTKVLRHPIRSIVSMNDTEMFCVTEAGQLYGIMLDASGTRIVSAAPAPEELSAVTDTPLFSLAEGVLTVPLADGSAKQLSVAALLACDNGSDLYYIESDGLTARLMAYPLMQTEPSLLAPAAREIGAAPADAISITATEDAVTMVKADHSITVVSLNDNAYHQFPASSQETTLAVSIGTKLIRLHENESGDGYVVEDAVEGFSAPTPAPTATLAPTAVPTATPKLTATPKPAGSSSASNDEDDGRIRYGASGSKVRKMQKRLAELGYPVGKADGDFGPNTLTAVHLFQSAIGYSERSYASSAMLNKLYGKSAPVYDRYAPLADGDKGEAVEILQRMLFALGYLGKDADEIDGKYGPITTAGVKLFQETWGIQPADGHADKATLERLCTLYDSYVSTGKIPVPTATPSPSPSPSPTPEPDPTPSVSDQPGSSETDQPGSSETDQPGSSETDQPGSSETDQPGSSETDQPGSSETDQPGSSETDQPGSSETDQPGSSETDQPGSSETDQPDSSETDQPGSSETDQPGSSETDQPGSSETDQPGSSETDQPVSGDSDPDPSTATDL